MKNIFIIIVLNFILLSCINDKYKLKKLYFLTFKDNLEVEVIKIDISQKALILNDSIVLYRNNRLIYKKNEPIWLFDKTKTLKGLKGEVLYAPIISEISPPYKLLKNKNTNTFQVIKEKDSLLFYLDRFDTIDMGLRRIFN